jgi:hypothetical protein
MNLMTKQTAPFIGGVFIGVKDDYANEEIAKHNSFNVFTIHCCYTF